jgi:hypothetical protein
MLASRSAASNGADVTHAARLARTAAEWEPDRGAMAVSDEQRRALRLLAGSPLGATEAIMLAHGFTNWRQRSGGQCGRGGSRSRSHESPHFQMTP